MNDVNPDVRKFLSDPLFVLLVQQGCQGPVWEEYEIKHQYYRDAMLEAKLIVLAAERLPVAQLSERNKQKLWKRIDQGIQEGAGATNRWFVWRWMTAAMLVLVAGLGWWYGSKNNPKRLASEYKADYRVIVNSGKQIYPVDLPDGSTVLLEPNSKLAYYVSRYQRQDKREVELTGEGFFEVVPNASKPFYVYTQGLTTKVLGTSFNVKAMADDRRVEVAVKTGKVAVYTSKNEVPEESGAKRTIVLPDEMIILDRVTHELLLEKSEKPEGADSLPTQELDDVPVPEVLDALQKSYDIRIRYDQQALNNCKITASFTRETLYEKIRLICKVFGADYKVSADGEIVIESGGCQ